MTSTPRSRSDWVKLWHDPIRACYTMETIAKKRLRPSFAAAMEPE